MVSAKIVEVEKNDNPSDEYVESIMLKVEESLFDLFKSERKPEWEQRPLEII